MKKSITVLTLIIGFITSTGFTTNEVVTEENKQSCLEIIGIAVDEQSKVIDGVEVKLFRKNDELEWLEVTSVYHHDHNFKFILDQDEYYTIEISKPGYVTRSVVVSTDLPRNVDPKPLFTFGFEVKMFKEMKGMDNYYLDFPVAMIRYNEDHRVFENSENYTGHIKRKIKEEENKFLVENMINGK